ncbi:MAG: hypothetical protein KAH23_02175 [Kiritimatiellae bacterium]|nr:hypothetical protein [Kiritimatiellia bacterium]
MTDKNKARSSGARDIAIVLTILIILVSGLVLIVWTLVNHMTEDPSSEDKPVNKVLTVETVHAATTTTTTTTTTTVPAPVEIKMDPVGKTVEKKPVKVITPIEVTISPEKAPPQELAPKQAPVPKKLDPALIKALKDVRSSELYKVTESIRILSGFHDEKAAFIALCNTALQHKVIATRVRAIKTLRGFKKFNPQKMCLQAIKSKEERVAYAVIDLAGRLKFSGYENVYIQGLRHSKPMVRRYAAYGVGNHEILDAEQQTAKVSRYDKDKQTRDSALRALCRLKSNEALSTLRNMLAGKSTSNKQRAFNYLKEWKSDDRALELLRRYKNDKIVGQRIKQHLERYDGG